MNRSTILMLEDDADRLSGFTAAVGKLGPSYRLVAWRDANRMIAECPEFLADAALSSLDALRLSSCISRTGSEFDLADQNGLLFLLEAQGDALALFIRPAEMDDDFGLDGDGSHELGRLGAVIVRLDLVGAVHGLVQAVFLRAVALGKVFADQSTNRGEIMVIHGQLPRRLGHVDVDVGHVGIPSHDDAQVQVEELLQSLIDRKSTRLNSSH